MKMLIIEDFSSATTVESVYKSISTPLLKKQIREIDEKLFNLQRLRFDDSEIIQKKIKEDLKNRSLEIAKEIESRKRKKKNGK